MVMGEGNGPIDAFVAALTGAGLFEGKVADYSEHTMGTGSDATAVAYVEIDTGGRDTTWGSACTNRSRASLRAIVSAVNTSGAEPNRSPSASRRASGTCSASRKRGDSSRRSDRCPLPGGGVPWPTPSSD